MKLQNLGDSQLSTRNMLFGIHPYANGRTFVTRDSRQNTIISLHYSQKTAELSGKKWRPPTQKPVKNTIVARQRGFIKPPEQLAGGTCGAAIRHD